MGLRRRGLLVAAVALASLGACSSGDKGSAVRAASSSTTTTSTTEASTTTAVSSSTEPLSPTTAAPATPTTKAPLTTRATPTSTTSTTGAPTTTAAAVTTTTAAPATTVTTAPPRPEAIAIRNFAFTPPALRVPAGTTVTATNFDGTSHTWTADDKAWSSGPLNQDGSFSRAFPTVGTFPYHCEIHPSMKGTVVVES